VGPPGHRHDYLDLDWYADAERATRASLRFDPTDPQLVLQLGTATAGLGRFNEQREQVRMVLRLQATPDVIDAVLELIELIEIRGIPDHFGELYQMTLAARGLPDLRRPGAAGTDPELLARQGRLAGRRAGPKTSRAPGNGRPNSRTRSSRSILATPRPARSGQQPARRVTRQRHDLAGHDRARDLALRCDRALRSLTQ
jgi:hypothetical protein